MKHLNIDRLNEEIIGISATRAAFYREAIIVALKKKGYESGVRMLISGEFEETFLLVWKDDIDASTMNSWRDETQIVNFGAVGIAILLMIEFLDIISFEESVIGTGIDFWVSTKATNDHLISFSKPEARLEVSGIFQEKIGNTINMRLGKKRKQTQVSDHLQLPAWIIVVEFSTPKSKIVRK